MMRDILVLALVQGITEFLPVSSSGHLVAVRVLFGISDAQGGAFDAFLHLGTLLAVLVYYRRVWWGLVRSLFTQNEEGKDKRELAAKLALATVPAAVVGFALEDIVEHYFRSGTVVAFGLILTAALLVIGDLWRGKNFHNERATFKDAVIIGLVQVCALIPGISRSGSTIAAGRWRGLSRRKATDFSFLMSAPIIAGAGLANIADLLEGFVYTPAELIIGFLVSFFSGLIAIYFLLKLIERISFTPFIIYVVVLAGALLYVQ